jgi:xanthine dehydrogenase accessory factor
VDRKGLRAALGEPFSFIGLLGSSRKKKNFFKTLAGEGVSEETLARVHTPVGLDIGARTPDEIAVAIMAQLIDHNRQVQSA